MGRFGVGRPSPALIVSFIALFVALSGTGYAVTATHPGATTAKKKKKKPKRHADRAQDIALIRSQAKRLRGPRGAKGQRGRPGPSTGPAGGDLSGSYPNPRIANGAVTAAKLGPPEPPHIVGAPGEPPFQNGFKPATALPYAAPSFYKDPYGVVRLAGRLAPGTAKAVIFSLPPGYRPPGVEAFLVSDGSAAPGPSAAAQELRVLPNGDVTSTTSDSPFLDGVSFRAGA